MCKSYDEDYLRGGRVVSVFYRHDYTLCNRLSALPYRLSDGCIVPAAQSNGLVTVKEGQFEGLGVAEGARQI